MWITASYVKRMTNQQMAQINEAKHKANAIIRAKRKALKAEIKQLEKLEVKSIIRSSPLRSLDTQLDDLGLVTGQPALVSIQGATICIDYGLLRKIDRSLAKRFWHRTIHIQPGRSLTIEYQIGTVELYELPAYWIELLSDLPVIEL